MPSVFTDHQFRIIPSPGQGTLYYKGGEAGAGFFKDLESGNYEAARQAFLRNAPFGSFIYEQGDILVALVDHIRAFPVFYVETGEGCLLSNNARLLAGQAKPDDADEISALELMSAGYISGNRTLYKSLKCLQPGEMLVARKGQPVELLRWHKYIPDPAQNYNAERGRAELNDILDKSIRDVIARAGGRPIWVPLSGGLDSRIIAAKLHEHGAKSVETFSYGPKFNFEMVHARKVADALGYKWRHVRVSAKEAREYFENPERKKFWRFAENLKALPSMREYAAVLKLYETGELPRDAILINGQSGDYITGGHISDVWFEREISESDTLFKIILDKHYDLWKGLKAPQHQEKLKERIAELFPQNWKSFDKSKDWAVAQEAWEYDARQICLVVNGQRNYDYLGLDWELPLWEKPLVDFCSTLPLTEKRNQKLFKDYLRAYNYKNLFPAKEPYIWRWPAPMLWVLPVAKIIGIARGGQAKKNFYALMKYFGHYSNQYSFFPFALHKKISGQGRNIFSIYAYQWATENRGLIPSWLGKIIGVTEADRVG